MKSVIIAIVLMLSASVMVTPSADNFASVTNDWYQGNWTNVYELAQQRLAANWLSVDCLSLQCFLSVRKRNTTLWLVWKRQICCGL